MLLYTSRNSLSTWYLLRSFIRVYKGEWQSILHERGKFLIFFKLSIGLHPEMPSGRRQNVPPLHVQYTIDSLSLSPKAKCSLL